MTKVQLTEHGKCVVQRLKEERQQLEELRAEEDFIVEPQWYSSYLGKHEE